MSQEPALPPELLKSFSGTVISVKLSQAVVVKDANGNRYWFRLPLDIPLEVRDEIVGEGEITGDNGEGLTFLKEVNFKVNYDEVDTDRELYVP